MTNKGMPSGPHLSFVICHLSLPLPTGRLIALLIAGGALLALRVLVPMGTAIGVAFDLLVFAALILDLRLAPRPGELLAQRRLPERLYIGQSNLVTIAVDNRSLRPARVWIRDDVPHELKARPAFPRVEVPPNREVEAQYQVDPPRRGDFFLGDIHIRWTGPLGLLFRQRTLPAAQTAKVYPRFVDYGRYQIEARLRSRTDVGLERALVPHRATEFESLRDYLPDDDPRTIDWKATARRGKPVVRNYQEERSKDIFILLDCGRMMAATAEGMSKLDHAINASLMLATVGIERGDRAGLLVFSETVKCFIPVSGRKPQIRQILDALYGVEPELIEPDYGRAFATLKTRHKRRSLVVLFTDVVDPDASSILRRHIATLSPPHLPLVITIQDEGLTRALAEDPTDAEGAYRRAVAEQVQLDRSLALMHLRRLGVAVLDVAARDLTVAAVNKYLEIKAAARL